MTTNEKFNQLPLWVKKAYHHDPALQRSVMEYLHGNVTWTFAIEVFARTKMEQFEAAKEELINQALFGPAPAIIVERERASLITELAKLREGNRLLKEECEREAKRFKNVQKLTPWVSHLEKCQIKLYGFTQCTCGLSAALKGGE